MKEGDLKSEILSTKFLKILNAPNSNDQNVKLISKYFVLNIEKFEFWICLEFSI